MSATPNILLVILDSVRAKNCGIYGHDNDTTPYLTELAERSTLFEQARAPSIQSVASHASIFSGYHAAEHGLTKHASQLDPTTTIWHELEAEYDYTTGIFSPNILITETSNLAAPFTKYSGPKRQTITKRFEDGLGPAEIEGDTNYVKYLRRSLTHSHPLRSIANGLDIMLTKQYIDHFSEASHDPKREHGSIYVDELIEWTEQQSGPWAACLNLMDAHTPYMPDDEHDHWAGDAIARLRDSMPNEAYSKIFIRGHPWGDLRALESLYDGCIRQLDAQIRRLVSELERTDAFEDTLLVLTSDHGEGFGERSTLSPAVRHVSHYWGVGEELLHVPLLIKAPGQQTGRTISSVASITRFPEAVRATLGDCKPREAFVPDNGIAVSSTNLLIPPGDKYPFSEAELRPYFGPWHAMYRGEQEGLVKYSEHQGDEHRERIVDAQVSFSLESIKENPLSAIFDGFEDAGVQMGYPADRLIDDGVTDRLGELGYIE